MEIWNQLSPLLERRFASLASERSNVVLNGCAGGMAGGGGEGEEEVARSVQFSVGCVPERMPRSRSRMWPLLHLVVLAAGLSCGDAQDGESLATSFLSGKPYPFDLLTLSVVKMDLQRIKL